MYHSTFFTVLLLMASVFLFQPALAQSRSSDAPIMSELLQTLGDGELDALRNYRQRSNSVRDRIVSLMGTPDTEVKKAQMLSLSHELHDLDESMRPVVEKLIRNGYWMTGGTRDKGMDLNVWLALQHIFDTDLVKITLEQTWPLVETGEFSGRNYATMYDRLATTEGRKQKFGTQTRCEDGRWRLWPLEDAERVEAFRQAFGFKSTLAEEEAEYGKRSCGNGG